MACRGSLLGCDYDQYKLCICGVGVMKENGVAESWMRHTVIYDPDRQGRASQGFPRAPRISPQKNKK